MISKWKTRPQESPIRSILYGWVAFFHRWSCDLRCFFTFAFGSVFLSFFVLMKDWPFEWPIGYMIIFVYAWVLFLCWKISLSTGVVSLMIRRFIRFQWLHWWVNLDAGKTQLSYCNPPRYVWLVYTQKDGSTTKKIGMLWKLKVFIQYVSHSDTIYVWYIYLHLLTWPMSKL